MQTPFAYECRTQEIAAPKTAEFSCEPSRQCRITAAGADRILTFHILFKERKLSAYSHYTSRQTDNQSYSFVPKQVCENLTGTRGDKNNINQRNLLHITNFQRGCNSEERRRTQKNAEEITTTRLQIRQAPAAKSGEKHEEKQQPPLWQVTVAKLKA